MDQEGLAPCIFYYGHCGRSNRVKAGMQAITHRIRDSRLHVSPLVGCVHGATDEDGDGECCAHNFSAQRREQQIVDTRVSAALQDARSTSTSIKMYSAQDEAGTPWLGRVESNARWRE